MDKSHETPFPPFLKHTFFFLPLPVILPFYSPFLILFFHSPPHLGLLFSFLSLFPSLYFLPSFLPNIFSILPSSSFSHPSFLPNIFSYPSFLLFLAYFLPSKYFLLFLPSILLSYQIFSPILPSAFFSHTSFLPNIFSYSFLPPLSPILPSDCFLPFLTSHPPPLSFFSALFLPLFLLLPLQNIVNKDSKYLIKD